MAQFCTFGISDSDFISNVSSKEHTLTFHYPGKSYNESSYYFVTCQQGYYIFENWGAAGYGNCGGSYTRGTIHFANQTTFYVYLGSKGIQYGINQMYNGGGAGDFGGGGSSDFRLVQGSWDNEVSLLSRIMVAGGGGGIDCCGNCGAGGGIFGINATDTVHFSPGLGALQIAGGFGYYPGSFGKGGGHVRIDVNGQRLDNGGGGGGGYYGGGSGKTASCCNGGGGSSFISGHPGCNSVFNTIPVQHSNQPFHFSGIAFINTLMISGNSNISLPNGGFGIGNVDNGAARITRVDCFYHYLIIHSDAYYMDYDSRFTFILLFFPFFMAIHFSI